MVTSRVHQCMMVCPFLRYKGDTQSKFLLTLGEEIYFELRDWFEERNDGEPLIHKGASSRKLKYQTKMVGILKQNLKDYNPERPYQIFCDKMEEPSGVTTQKRSRICQLMDMKMQKMFYLVKLMS